MSYDCRKIDRFAESEFWADWPFDLNQDFDEILP
jgi:hypothetical protein